MDFLVETDWLAERLKDPKTVVLDATLPPVGATSPPVGAVPAANTRARYVAEHIPGAIFFDIDELSNHSTDLPHMLPSGEAFSRQMGELGVSDRATIVVYEQEGVFSAPRAWWMLRTFGASDVHVLNGGLRAWREAGLATESGEVRRPRATFAAKLNSDAVRTLAMVRQTIAQGGQIADARSAGRFAGTMPEPRPNLRSGHMPGSTSVPFVELVEDGRLKSAARMSEVFAAKGLDLEQPITTTCGSGVTAAVVLLGLELAGAKQVRLYDGSWAEYAREPDAAIETA